MACVPEEAIPPEPETLEPHILVGLAVDVPALELGGGGRLAVAGPDGAVLLDVSPGIRLAAGPGADGVRLSSEGAPVASAPRLTLSPVAPDSLVRVGGRDYRGEVILTRTAAGLLAVNRLPMESYLAGVVNAEMGRRAANEQEALLAQAIVARTFALRALGRSRLRGYDVVATVSDQAYGGVAAEQEQGRQAVEASRGVILAYGGQPIDAFYHSTCGGRTASGEEVYASGARPYLQSLADLAPDGTAWCAISPRYRWEHRWTAAALTEILRGTLPPLGVPAGRVTGLRDLAVTGHTASGRVARITIELANAVVPVEGQAIRSALRPGPEELLRSTSFRLVLDRAGGRLERVTAVGGGAGHGVGLCQWGAVGRARAGASAFEILAAYFPGTDLERRW